MATKTLVYKDATVTVHASLFGEPTVDVECQQLDQKGMSLDEFAALIYPAIAEAAAAVATANAAKGTNG